MTAPALIRTNPCRKSFASLKTCAARRCRPLGQCKVPYIIGSSFVVAIVLRLISSTAVVLSRACQFAWALPVSKTNTNWATLSVRLSSCRIFSLTKSPGGIQSCLHLV